MAVVNWPALVERLARALGVWMGNGERDSQAAPSEGLAVGIRADGMALVRTPESRKFRPVGPLACTIGNALWLLLEVARGQRLDVGPCRACAQRGGGWEWGKAETWSLANLMESGGWQRGEWVHYPKSDITRWTHLTRPCPECSEPKDTVDCHACDGRGQRSDAAGLLSDDAVAMFATREIARAWCRAQGFPVSLVCRHNMSGRVESKHPWAISTYTQGRGPLCWSEAHHHPEHYAGIGRRCPKCDGEGRVPGPPQPTGRRVLEPWVWVLDAITPQVHKGVGFGSDASVADAERCAQEHARSIGAVAHVIGNWQPTPSSWHVSCEIRWPGDPAVRAAASWLTRSTTPDGAAVLGDWRRVFPDKGPDKCSLPPDSAWGLVIAAGLLGACQGCDGGWVHEWTQATGQGWNPVAPGLPEPVLPWTGVVRERWSAREGRACRKVECPDCRTLGLALGAPSIAVERLAVAECEAREDSPPSTPTQDRPEPDDMHGAADGFGGQDIHGWE